MLTIRSGLGPIFELFDRSSSHATFVCRGFAASLKARLFSPGLSVFASVRSPSAPTGTESTREGRLDFSGRGRHSPRSHGSVVSTRTTSTRWSSLTQRCESSARTIASASRTNDALHRLGRNDSLGPRQQHERDTDVRRLRKDVYARGGLLEEEGLSKGKGRNLGFKATTLTLHSLL